MHMSIQKRRRWRMAGVVMGLLLFIVMALLLSRYQESVESSNSNGSHDLPRYDSYQPSILSFVTHESERSVGKIWLARIDSDGQLSYYELASARSTKRVLPPFNSEVPFYLVECYSLRSTVCAVELPATPSSDAPKLHRWKVIDWALGNKPYIEAEEQSLRLPNEARVTSVIREGIIYDYKSDLSDDDGIYFLKLPDSVPTKILEDSTGACLTPGQRLSPRGDLITSMCMYPSQVWWLTRVPTEPNKQQLRVVSLDDFIQRVLTPQITYPFDKFCLSSIYIRHPKCTVPKYAWSHDGTRIAFVTALTPPAVISRNPFPTPQVFSSAGAIYSVSVEGSDMRKLVQVGDENPPLDWSPDGKYIAYGHSILSIVSAAGNNYPVRSKDFSSTENIRDVAWSPDGAYIAILSEKIEMLKTLDYTWHELNFLGEPIEVKWIWP